ncbi:MAG TPA: response regulator, partial [Burkholderiaceae bacterium]|nr:response regulator [Burkholderiaceae bacterium]
MRILVIEDDPLVADVVATGLRDAGFVVDPVGSAESADTALATEHFDLIVLDLGLPGRDGLQFLSALRRGGSERARVPVLVLTARDGLDDRVGGL